MFVSFVQIHEGPQRFMALETEAEAREDLADFLTEWQFDGSTLDELIALAVEGGYVIGIGPSHDWVGLDS